MSKQKLSKEECQKLFNKILRLIKKVDKTFFVLKKLKGIMGYCEWENGIGIDYRREFVPTLIHECIHYLNPEWTETQVLYAEKRIVNVLNTTQVIKLLKVFINKL